MNEFRSEHTLSFTEDEAMGLLDIVMMSPTDLSPEQRAAAEKLSNFCREIMRDTSGADRAAATSSGKNGKTPAYAA